MKRYTCYLYDLAENGKPFGCWYTTEEAAAMLERGMELYYDKELTQRCTDVHDIPA